MKIRPKHIDCIFIGYAHNSISYRFLVHELNILDIFKNAIMESRNASFFKDVFPCKSKEELSSSKQVLETINEKSQDQDGVVEPRCNKKARTKKYFGPGFQKYVLEREPRTFKELVDSTEGLMWK